MNQKTKLKTKSLAKVAIAISFVVLLSSFYIIFTFFTQKDARVKIAKQENFFQVIEEIEQNAFNMGTKDISKIELDKFREYLELNYGREVDPIILNDLVSCATCCNIAGRLACSNCMAPAACPTCCAARNDVFEISDLFMDNSLD